MDSDRPVFVTVEPDKSLLKEVDARAEELGVVRELAVLELIFLGLERLQKLPAIGVRKAPAAVLPERSYLRFKEEVYEVLAENPREALVSQLKKFGASQTVVGAPQIKEAGKWVFGVAGFAINGQAVEKVEVFDRYPR